MILIIGDEKHLLDELFEDIKRGDIEEISDEVDIKMVIEVGRCITPVDALEREFIKEQGRIGRELAKEANKVFLYRNKILKRIK